MANLYGRTINTSDPFFGETEDDAVILMQQVEHTLQTRRGTLRTRPEHGVDLPGLLLTSLDDAARVSIPARVKAALEQCAIIASADVALTSTSLGGGKVAIALEITVQGAGGGPQITYTRPLDDTLADFMITGT